VGVNVHPAGALHVTALQQTLIRETAHSRRQGRLTRRDRVTQDIEHSTAAHEGARVECVERGDSLADVTDQPTFGTHSGHVVEIDTTCCPNRVVDRKHRTIQRQLPTHQTAQDRPIEQVVGHDQQERLAPQRFFGS
jgi:hypothetical protein